MTTERSSKTNGYIVILVIVLIALFMGTWASTFRFPRVEAKSERISVPFHHMVEKQNNPKECGRNYPLEKGSVDAVHQMGRGTWPNPCAPVLAIPTSTPTPTMVAVQVRITFTPKPTRPHTDNTPITVGNTPVPATPVPTDPPTSVPTQCEPDDDDVDPYEEGNDEHGEDDECENDGVDND